MPTFLFVNKTQGSAVLTRGEASETTAIQHFVQKGRKRARKVKLTAATKARPPVKVAEDAVPADNDSEKSWDVHDYIRNCQNVLDDSSKLPSQKCIEPARVYCASKTFAVNNVSGAIDPFQTTVITIDSGVRSLINYFTTVLNPIVWPNESQALRKKGSIFDNGVNLVVQTSLHDALSMYSLLSASVSRLRHMDHFPLPEATKSREMEYMTQALKLVQQRVDQAADCPGTSLLSLLNSIILLSSAEGYRGNARAAQTHLQGCISVFAYHSMSVMDITDTRLQDQCLMSDLFNSCMILKACLFNADDYDPGPVKVINLQVSELDPLPESLSYIATSLLYDANLSNQLRTLTDHIKEIYITKHRLSTSTMTSTRALETARWITQRSRSTRNRLLSAFLHDGTGEVPDLSAEELLDKAIRITLIQFMLLSMNITGRIKTVKIMSRHLQDYLAPLVLTGPRRTHRRPELLLWMAVIGYSCAYEGSDNEEWFANRCRELIQDSGLSPYPSSEGVSDDGEARLRRLEQIQSTYFYHEQDQRPRLRKLLMIP